MLEINGLTKKYDADAGIENIELSLEGGVIYAFIGPNGAGKTTLLKSVAGLLRPDAGKVLLNDDDTLLRGTKKEIGFSLDSDIYYPAMKLEELLIFVSQSKYGSYDSDEIKDYLERYELLEHKNKYFQDCSTGMKKKLGIIMSFMGNPDAILLDEPTNGVDTTGIIRIKEDILRAKKRGAVVIITSHVLDFLTQIADSCFFMEHGKIVKTIEVAQGENLEEIYKEMFLNGE